jgi:hypothetical protein
MTVLQGERMLLGRSKVRKNLSGMMDTSVQL